MRIVLSALFLLTSALSTHAADCKVWQAGMSEEEEGTVMAASICAGEDYLILRCTPEGLMIRFMPRAAPVNPQTPFDLRLSAGDHSAAIATRYEEMDGALAAYLDRQDPAISLLGGRGPLTITDTSGRVPATTFTLSGSTAAIAALEKTCQR